LTSGGDIDFEGALPGVGAASCPHMAILLDSTDQVAPALASFYSLGLRRNGWVFHRALPGEGETDRHALEAEGLAVTALEREGRFELCELPISDPPEVWAKPYVPVVEEKLERGFDAVWWSRFPVGGDDKLFELALAYDRHWDAAFHEGGRAVSLCVYIVGDLPASARRQRVDSLREVHDSTFVLEPDRRLTPQSRADAL
jgi:hypothetical protein